MRRAQTVAGAVAALALSGALHAAGMLAALPRVTPVALAGGGGFETTALGTAFEDFAAGANPVVAATTPPVLPDPVRQIVRPVLQPAPMPPVPTSAPPAVTPSPPTPTPVAPQVAVLPPGTAAVLPPVMAQVQTTTTEADLAAPAIARAAADLPEAQPAPKQMVSRPETSETVAPAPPSDTGLASSDLAPEVAPRPPDRPEPRRAEARALEQRRAAETPAQPPAGNAASDARRGSATGQDGARAASEGPGAPLAASAGNAAASSYPGLVLRQITRLRRPRAPARGTVVVAFQVAGSGALASVSVTRSSGSAALDRLALDHIRRAAPFPPPPTGAELTFSFAFEGRP